MVDTKPDIANRLVARLMDEFSIGEFEPSFGDEPGYWDATKSEDVAKLIREVLESKNHEQL